MKVNTSKYYLIIGLMLMAGLFFLIKAKNSPNAKYTIASGKPGAGYQNFSKALLPLSKETSLPFSIEILETSGSVENIALLEKGEAQLGLVQSAITSGENISVIAPLYRDVVHILIPQDSTLNSLSDLRGKRLSLGLSGSGTEQVNYQLLSHYGIGEEDVTAVALAPEKASAALLEGEIDVFMMVTALRAPVIEKLISTGKVKFMSIGRAGELGNIAYGINEHFPHLKPYIIPRHTYAASTAGMNAFPREPVSTLSVTSFLVCRTDVSKNHVYRLTKSLFEHKHFMTRMVTEARHIHEIDNRSAIPYEVHAGAKRYYRRNDPSFLVVYAEVIALIVSLIITAVGMLSALRRWAAARRKNRVDRYYHEINATLKRLHDSDEVVDLDLEERKLWALRYKAIEELADEKLTADESFRIFQTLLANCLKEIQWKREKVNEAASSSL